MWKHNYTAPPPRDVSAYDVIIDFWFALSERMKPFEANAVPRWPRTSYVWGEETITAATSTTITAAAADWIVPADQPGTGNPPLVPRWTSWQSPQDRRYVPTSYDAILNCDDPDPTRHVHVRIAGNDETTLTLAPAAAIANQVTAGWLPSIDYLVGKRVAIIKRGGLWWGELWPRRPNDPEHWRGIGTGMTLVAIGGDGWTDGDYAGMTLAVGPAGAPTLTTTIAESTGGVQVIGWTASAALAAGATARVLDGSTVLASGTIATVEDGLWAADAELKPGASSGEDLLVYAGDLLYRIPVVRYVTMAVVIARQPARMLGAWSVVAAGDRAWPGVELDPPFRWYGGATHPYRTHRATDRLYQAELSSVPMPATTVDWEEGDGVTCTLVSHPAFDRDVWTDTYEMCAEADQPYSPDLFKTLRQMQAVVEDYCGNYVPPTSPSGSKALNTFSFATLCQYAGINFVGTFAATADASGVAAFAVGDEPYPLAVDLRRVRDDLRIMAGPAMAAAGVVTIGSLQPGEAYNLIVARGWTRRFPQEFSYGYPRSAFVPDVRTTIEGSFAVVPGSAEYPGQWIERTASTEYKRTDGFGFTTGGGPFLDGVRARYVGDAWADPAITPRSRADEPGGLEAPYWGNFWEGRFYPELRSLYETMRVGTVAYGGATWIDASGPARWYGSPIGDGLLQTIAGFASAGGAGVLIDDAKFFLPEDAEPGDEIMDRRWAQLGRWVGNVLEVDRVVDDVDGNAVTVTYRTPITGQPGFVDPTSRPTVHFDAVAAYAIPEVPATETTPRVPAIDVPALASVAAGDAYRIREPRTRRNWWRGRTLRITPAGGGAAVERTITHSDDRRLWWSTPIDFDPAGAAFEIVELEVGGVYAWNAAAQAWKAPTDNAKALPLTSLAPATVTAYGRTLKRDYATPVLRELYLAINALVWFLKPAFPVSREDATIEEKNIVDARAGNASERDYTNDPDRCISDLYGIYEEALALGGFVGHDGLVSADNYEYVTYVPDAGEQPSTDIGWAKAVMQYFAQTPDYVYSTSPRPDTYYSSTLVRRYCYARIVNAPTSLQSAVEWVNFAVHDEAGDLDTSNSVDRFDSVGDPVAKDRWTTWASSGASSDAIRQSPILGSKDAPDPPQEKPKLVPTQVGTQNIWAGQAISNGYDVIRAAAILKFDVPGGFEYVG